MGVVGIAALIANGGVALMVYRFRTGDANLRSVWICLRDDAVGNAAVMLAAMGVFGTGTGWPDVVVAAVMGALCCRGAGKSAGRQGASFATDALRRSVWRRNSKARLMGVSKQPSIAGCLSIGEYQSRVAWIESLTRKSLRGRTRDDLVLRLFLRRKPPPTF
jgi:hypothetical protein